MKARYFMAAIGAALSMGFAFTACDVDQDPDTFLSNLTVTQSYISLNPDGGSAEFTVNAKSNWYFAEVPAWLTIDPKEGEAGQHTVKFSAEKTVDGRSAEVLLYLGDSVTCQRINVIQGLSTISSVTCAEVLAGPDSKTYQVTGTVTSIANTKYGNWYLNDGTGEVYVYGTLYDGKTQNDPIVNNKIEVGDEVTIQGPKTTYNGTVELVDVTVVKVNKSLLKCDSTLVDGVKSAELPVDGGILTAYLTNKCNGFNIAIPEDAQDWLTIASISGNTVSFKAAANEGGDRTTTLVFTANDGKKDYTAKVDIAQKGAVVEVSCAEFNALEDGVAQYKVRGIITSIASTKYGNVYINDGTGEVYVYGITDWAASGLKVGDEVVLQSVKTSYKDAPQMKNAVVLESVAHDTKTVADFLATEESKTVYYILRGAVTEAEGKTIEPYGNFNLVDATGSVYVYGVLNNMKDKASKQFATLNVAVGDTITILGYHTSYSGAPQVGGAIFIKNEKPATPAEE
jgi:RPA family protein